MQDLSVTQLEEISRRVLRAYWKLPLTQETPWYVDPEMLLTDLLGLKIHYHHLSDDGMTLGMTSFGDVEIEIPDCESGTMILLDGKTVLIERDLLKPNSVIGRRNFTVAHEGSHHILNMLYPGAYSSGEKARSVIKYRINGNQSAHSREEWQMDTLASFLLMPADLLRKNMKLVGLPERLDYLNQVWRRSEYEKFTFLADLMGVSKQALSYRMLQLGLLGEDQRMAPNKILDVWSD